uniref:Terminase large subunit GpA endonuclease domain-containing protein n=1 Tax=Schlesneria paludicola TaxID=360056 RepID=A0A7C4LKL9_9PLAN
MKFKRPDGKSVRPSLVVLDDPQTDESARSISQCQQRESILAGAVLGLAGPGHKISGIMPCTVIRPGDMADRILDRDKHAQWQGERTKMVYAFPTNKALWDRYAEVRAEGLRNEDGGVAATEFYRRHRKEMDAGARIAWPERFNYDELSAVQHAMNLKLQDEAAFWAEYQNEPLPEETADDDLLTTDQIAAKCNRLPRRLVPIGCNHLTMFIDVQANLLFFVVCAWEDDFTVYVIDYDTFPDKKRYRLNRSQRPSPSSARGPVLWRRRRLSARLVSLCQFPSVSLPLVRPSCRRFRRSTRSAPRPATFVPCACPLAAAAAQPGCH